jgi:hypothetical protein
MHSRDEQTLNELSMFSFRLLPLTEGTGNSLDSEEEQPWTSPRAQ